MPILMSTPTPNFPSTSRKVMYDKALTCFENHMEDQLQLLQKLVLQSSYTEDKPGVDAVGHLMEEFLTKECGLSVERHPEAHHGDNLVFKTPAAKKDGASPILLVGHMDTVFPPGSEFNWFKDDGEKLFGPGVIDMKGGLVVAASSLQALHKTGLLNTIPITFICNSDEETGSLTSKAIIEKEASKSAIGLVYECGGLNGEIVTGRKGKTGYTLKVHGKAGHAAFAGKNKASAIHELALKIPQLEQLNDQKKQLVVNVGVIQGGMGPNTVAEYAEALIDTRFLTVADSKNTQEKIETITTACSVPDTHAELAITSGRLPMEQSHKNRQLYQVIAKAADRLGIKVCDELRSGVSDANTIAGCNIPVIDGLGPIGDCDHSDREYMVKSSLVEKTRLSIATLLSLSEKEE